MATLMPLCAGLVGPKSENVEISLVLPLLFEGSRGPRVRQDREQFAEPWGLGGGRSRFLVKNASCRFGELCFLLRQEPHFCKNGETIWPESEKCTQKHLDADIDAYMYGLGGAEKRKC